MTGYRTIIAAVAVILLGALQAAGAVDWIMLLGDKQAGAVVSAIGVAMGVLRWITTGPLGKS